VTVDREPGMGSPSVDYQTDGVTGLRGNARPRPDLHDPAYLAATSGTPAPASDTPLPADPNAGVATPAITYSITGFVTNPDVGPLAGIQVSTRTSSGGSEWSTPVETAADGSYSLSASTGYWYVRFVDPTDAYASGYYTASGLNLTQADEVHVQSADVPNISVALPIARRISGTVSNADSEPLAGITAYLHTATESTLRETTASDGTYSFAVPAGSYTLVFSDDSWTYIAGWYSFSGWTDDNSARSTIVVGTEDWTGVDITLPAWPRFTGRVIDGQGVGIGNIRVTSYTRPAWGFFETTTTAADGTYSVRGYEGASYSIEYSDISGYYWDGWYGGSGYVSQEASASVLVATSGDSPLADVVLPAYPRVKGKVARAGGAGIPGIDVSICKGSVGFRNCYPHGLTSADGTYSLRAVADTYYVKFTDTTGTSYLTGWYSSSGFTKEEGEATALVVTTEDVTGIDVILPAYMHINGRVTNSAAAGIANVVVTAHLSSNPDYAYKSTSTLADGTYSIPVEPGSYLLSFGSVTGYAGGWYTASGWSWGRDLSALVTVGAVDVVGFDITLPPLLHITGLVTDMEGAPVSGIYVQTQPTRGNLSSVTTAADGSYSLGVPPGTYTIEITATQDCLCGWYSSSGYVYVWDDATPVTVSAADVNGISVAMPGVLHIKGKVTNTDAAGISGITVEVIRDGASYATTATAGDGTYSIVVPHGTYRVEFTDSTNAHASGWYADAGLTYDSGAAERVTVSLVDATLNVTLPDGHLLAGKVSNAGGSGLSGIYVEAWIDGSLYSGAYSDSSGDYILPVAPGSVTLFFYSSAGSYAGGWRTPTSGVAYDWDLAAQTIVTNAAVSGVNVTMPAARHIKGKVTNKSGKGLASVWVVAYANGSTAGWAMSASDGTYSIPVTPGTYTLHFEDLSGTYAGGWRTSSGFTTDPRTVSAITVSSVDLVSINIVLPSARAIEGRLYTSRWGQAVSDAEVDVFSNGGYYTSVAADKWGYFRIVVAPGTYRIGFYDDSWVFRSGYYNSTSGFVSDWAASSNVSTATTNAMIGEIELPLAAAPAAPTGVGAIGYHHSALVSWSEAADDGGMPIDQYTVTASPGGATCETEWYLFCTVTGLDNGTAYTFTVAATSVIGTSAPSAPSNEVTPAAVPDEPGAVRAVGANLSAVVSWTVPANNGSAITGYTVTSYPGGLTCTSATTLCTVTGLTNGTYYWFLVSATNTNGTGPEGLSNGAVANPKLVRYGGANVYASAAAISANTFPANCYCTAYIAYGGNFPDALAGAAAAGSAPGPMLFVATTGAINTSTAAELTRLKPNRIVVLGSELVISASVYNALHAYGPVYRYAGNDRFATASVISGKTFGADCHCTAYVAYAMNFPDALAAAAAAGTVPGPVLLVSTTGTLSAASNAELRRLKPTKIVVLGSTVVISAAVMSSLNAIAPAVRYYGRSRYDTAADISSHTFSADCGCVAYISAGTDFNGALSGAAAAGWIGGPLLLVGTTGAIPPSTAAELTRLKPVRIVVLGGTDKVSTAVFNALAPYAPAP
jgi:putative cell wall-binding protein